VVARKRYHPEASSDGVRERMQAQPRRDTKCELAVRSAVHALGLRYRVHQRPLPCLRREADMVFRRDKVAVFVDGCFWHGCPEHHSPPTSHYHWWQTKVGKNRARDEETNRILREHGWELVRVWEHECPEDAARRIQDAVLGRRTPKEDDT